MSHDAHQEHLARPLRDCASGVASCRPAVSGCEAEEYRLKKSGEELRGVVRRKVKRPINAS